MYSGQTNAVSWSTLISGTKERSKSGEDLFVENAISGTKTRSKFEKDPIKLAFLVLSPLSKNSFRATGGAQLRGFASEPILQGCNGGGSFRIKQG